MTMTLLLYWFPIFLGVAVGTTLLGGLPRPRGAALALICAIFWIALVQSRLDAPFWRSGGMLLATLAGAGAIALMGLCGPEGASASGAPRAPASSKAAAPLPAAPVAAEDSVAGPTMTALRQFEAWLEAHRHGDDPWADFDEFLRGLIYQTVGGTHVRTFAVLDSGEHLAPLRAPEPDEPGERVSARTGVIGYVATTGRSFVLGDSTQGGLIEHLSKGEARDPDPGTGPARAVAGRWRGDRPVSAEPPAWCFAVTRHGGRIGVVAALGLNGGIPDGERNRPHSLDRVQRDRLRLVETLVNCFWNTLIEVERGRAAITTDPGSGVLTRKAFFEIGHESMSEADRNAEPVAVAILAMEGVRALDDDGHWDAADDIRAVVSGVLMKRLRAEDRIGRFDDSRFVLLLRRVDSELAQLIVRELMTQLSEAIRSRKPYGDRIELRCGLAGTGVRGQLGERAGPDLRELTATAVGACGEARRRSAAMASDLNVRAGAAAG